MVKWQEYSDEISELEAELAATRDQVSPQSITLAPNHHQLQGGRFIIIITIIIPRSSSLQSSSSFRWSCKFEDEVVSSSLQPLDVS